VALFVLLIVGVVVAQTWLDWRDTKKTWVVPDWAQGLALAGVVGAVITAGVSFASFWMQQGPGQGASALGFGSRLFWPEAGFLLCALGVVVAAARRKRLKLLLVLSGLLLGAFWLGFVITS
jgi:hypothetical protein